MTASGGIATFTNLADDTAETITLHFTSSPVLTAATSSNIVVSPAAASQLVINTQPSPTATAGVAFGTQPVVYVEDQYGNLETGDNATQVTAALDSRHRAASGNDHGDGLGRHRDVHQPGGRHGRDHLASVHQLAGPHRSDFQQHRDQPAAASQLVIHTQPSPTATAGAAFGTQPVIYVEDQYGNLETGDNATQVTAALDTGTGPLLGNHDGDGLGRHRHVHQPGR